MLSAWLAWRLCKWGALGALVLGLGRATGAGAQAHRLRGALWTATAGLILAWVAGYGLLRATGGDLRDPFVPLSLLTGAVCLGGAALGAVRPGRAWGLALGWGGLAGAVGAMVGRADPATAGAYALVLGGATALGGALWGARQPPAPVDLAASRAAVWPWFQWLGRAEGASLLFMLFVYMPLKYGAGVVLDGGQGWVGWIHGALLLPYVVALVAAREVMDWRWWWVPLGCLAALFPGGTFLVEHRLRPQASV